MDRNLDTIQFNKSSPIHDTEEGITMKVRAFLNTGTIPFSGPGGGQNPSHCLGWLFCWETSHLTSASGSTSGKGKSPLSWDWLLCGWKEYAPQSWLTNPGEMVYGLLAGLEVIGRRKTWRSFNSSFKVKLADSPGEAHWRHWENTGQTTQPGATYISVTSDPFGGSTVSSKFITRSTSTTFSHWGDLYATSTCSAGQVWGILEA